MILYSHDLMLKRLNRGIKYSYILWNLQYSKITQVSVFQILSIAALTALKFKWFLFYSNDFK